MPLLCEVQRKINSVVTCRKLGGSVFHYDGEKLTLDGDFAADDLLALALVLKPSIRVALALVLRALDRECCCKGAECHWTAEEGVPALQAVRGILRPIEPC